MEHILMSLMKLLSQTWICGYNLLFCFIRDIQVIDKFGLHFMADIEKTQ